MKPDPMNLLSVLDTFAFWKVQTIHSGGRRRYRCELRAEGGGPNRRTYTATGATPQDAMRRAISKATSRNKHQVAPTENEVTLARDANGRPRLRLTE